MTQQDVNDEQGLLTVSEAAAALRVNRTTVWRWIEEGRLNAFRAGRRTIRIRRDDLEAALAPARTPKVVTAREAEGDLWASYKPDRVRSALRSAAGAFAGVDRDALLRDIREARDQD